MVDFQGLYLRAMHFIGTWWVLINLDPVYVYLHRRYETDKIDGQYGSALHYNYCSNKLIEVICQTLNETGALKQHIYTRFIL